MSLNWDSIDSRQLKAKQEAKDLKDYLQTQQEEKKKRLQQERFNEREAYKSNTFGQSLEKKVDVVPQRNAPQAIKQTTLNPVSPLPKIADDSNLSASRLAFLNDYSKPIQEFDFSSTDNFLSKLRETESQITADRKSQSLQSELQNTKLLVNTLAAKFELLQEQSKNENNNFRDLNRELERRDRQSKEAIEILHRKLDQESKRVLILVEEITKARQNEKSLELNHQEQMKQVQTKVEQLAARLEGYVQQSNQVGANLNSASTQLQIESRRNEETIKAVQMHEHALTTLSSNMDSSVTAFTNKIQMAANELFLKIDGEAKARKGLEESIRQDAMEFRRMIERHITERVDSVKAYSQVQGEHDRQAIEAISNSFNTKLKRLEESTGGSLEQIGGLLNQRISIVENSIEEIALFNKRLEVKLQTSATETIQFLESMIAKRDSDSEKRLKEVSKSVLAVQKALHDSISITEKTLAKKVKGVEDVLRAEIHARLEIDGKLSSFKGDAQATFESQQSQIQKLLEMVEQGKHDQEKTLELVKTVAQQLTHSQDRWVENFEKEIVKLNDSIEKQASSTSSTINQTKDQILQAHDAFVTEAQDNHAQVVLDLQETKTQSEKIKVILSEMETNMQTMAEEVEQKFVAKYVQLDTTLEAFKLEFAARPTKDALEDRIAELETELEQERKSLQEEIDKLSAKQKSFVEVGVVDSLDKEVDQFKASNKAKIAELESLVEKTSAEWQNFKSVEQVDKQKDIENQLDTILSRQDELTDLVNKNQVSLEEFKAATNSNILEGKESILGHQNQIEAIKVLLQEEKEQINTLTERVQVVQDQAKIRDTRISALSDEMNNQNEGLSRKIIESADKNSKIATNINLEIQKLSEQVLLNKSQNEKSSEQIAHLRESGEASSKTTKQNLSEINKRLEDLTTTTQSQLEANSRKISLLTLNLESSILQNQNDHTLIQEDLAFTKRSLTAAKDSAQEKKNEEIEAQIQQTNMLLEETKKDVETISKKTHSLERKLNSKIVEVNEASEKRGAEHGAQVDQLKDLVIKAEENLSSKVGHNSISIEQLSREVKVLKGDVHQVEKDHARLQSEIKRIGANGDTSKSYYALKSSKSPRPGTTPRGTSRVELNDKITDTGLPVQHSTENIEY